MLGRTRGENAVYWSLKLGPYVAQALLTALMCWTRSPRPAGPQTRQAAGRASVYPRTGVRA